MVDEIKTWLSGKRSYTEGVQLYVKHGHDKALKDLFLWEPWSAFKEAKLLKALEGLLIGPDGDKTIQHKAELYIPGGGIKEVFFAPIDNIKAAVPAHEFVTEELQESINSIKGDVDDVDWRLGNLEYDLEEKILPIEQLQKDVAHLKNNTIPKSKGWPQIMDSTMQQLHREWLPLFNEKKNLQARLHDVADAGATNEKKKEEAGAMAAKILDLRDAIRKIYSKRDAYKATGKLPEEKKPFDLEIPTDPKKWPITLANYQRYVRDYKAKLKNKPGNEGFKKQLAKYEWGLAEIKKLLGE